MADGSPITRRRLLSLVGAGGAAGFAGCNRSNTGPSPTNQQATTSSIDTGGPTESPTATDTSAPSIEEFAARPSDEAGKLAYHLVATDDTGLAHLQVESPAGSVDRSLDGETEAKVDGSVEAAGGERSPVRARVEDRAGKTAERTAESYARAYPISADWPLDIGAVYDLMAGDEPWAECYGGGPTIGPYGAPPEPTALDRQIDQAQGHGIGRFVVRMQQARELNPLGEILQADLLGSVPFEVSYDPHKALTGSGSLDADLAAIRAAYETVPVYSSLDGRPVVTLRRLTTWDDGFVPHEGITSTFDSVERFGTAVREALTTDDGTQPFLIGQVAPNRSEFLDRVSDEALRLADQFDAVLGDLWDPGAGSVPWEASYRRNVDRLAAGRLFAAARGLEFVPVVYPGWDHAANACRDSEERIPRSPANLTALLEAAVIYATSNRIRLDSFNDWRNGTQVEPGRAGGTAYGDTFLGAVRTVQATTTRPDFHGRSEYYVAPDGLNRNAGSPSAPLASIQHAVERALPGDTIHVRPGQYFEDVQTVRPGESGAPITITGPPDAVIRGEPGGYSAGFTVKHGHVHIRGLTIDGLQDPANPDDATSYMNIGIHTIPIDRVYLEDLVFKPHAIGNTRGAMITLSFVEDVEIGEFRVIGPAGVDFQLGEKVGHFGEVVYVGSPIGSRFNAYDLVGHGELGEIDRTNDVHVHHIDASAGYHHIELVDVKAGSHDVTVEYCTSVDARLPNDNDNSSAVHLGGTDTTFRWNRIESPAFNAMDVGNYGPFNENIPNPDAPDAGAKNEIYGNELVGAGNLAINYTEEVSEADQRVVCGNVVDTDTHGQPGRDCGADVPTGDDIGHSGGDSPW